MSAPEQTTIQTFEDRLWLWGGLVVRGLVAAQFLYWLLKMIGFAFSVSDWPNISGEWQFSAMMIAAFMAVGAFLERLLEALGRKPRGAAHAD